MSLKAIDKALENKLKSVYPNVVFGPLARALENSADSRGNVEYNGLVVSSGPNDYKITENKNNNPVAQLGAPPTYEGRSEDRTPKHVVKFPLIAFDRINNPYGDDFQANDAMTRKGRFVVEKGYREKAFPVTPMYQIDIISDRRTEVDELWRELSMFLFIHNEVDVEYQNGEECFSESYPIKLLDTDNTTDVDSFFDKGSIYRQTISLEVTNAKMLFKSDTKLIETIPTRYVKF